MPASACWGKETCPKCGREYWQRYSRITPFALTAEEFAAKYIVDENAREIRERNPTPELTVEQKAVQAMIREEFARRLEHEILYGSGAEVPTGLIKSRAN
jgi:hypothetical protein